MAENIKPRTYPKGEPTIIIKSLLHDAYSDFCELLNNLEDDLEMDKTGESGYKNEKEVVRAIKKYTFKLLNKKIEKWGNLK